MKILLKYSKGIFPKTKAIYIKKGEEIWQGIDKFLKNDIITKNKIKGISFKYERKEPKSLVGERVLRTISKGLKISKKF
jgi:hypothetical protein